MGYPPAADDDGNIHRDLRHLCQDSFGWLALSHLCLHGLITLAFLLPGDQQQRQQPGKQRQLNQESLFSAAHCADRRRTRTAGRFRHCLCHAAQHDGMVRHSPHLGPPRLAPFPPPSSHDRSGCELLSVGSECEYRDVRHTIPFLVQFWMYASPVAYPVSLVPEKWRLLYGLNPMVGVIDGFRWALLGEVRPDFGLMAVSTAVVLALLLGGIVYFKRMERTFADVI